MMTDRLTCFTQLNKSVPKWLESLADLDTRVKAQPQDSVPAPRPTHKRSGSMESLRPSQEPGVPTASAAVFTSTPHHDKPVQRQKGIPAFPANPAPSPACCKRNSTSMLSGHASGPPKTVYRGRQRRVVYYDGDVQKGLEQLVRHVAGARNMLRKAKTQARMEALSESTGATDDESSSPPPTGGLTAAPKAVAIERLSMSVTGHASKTTVVFDEADKALESTQAFTERAAYTFLRHGECTAEFDGAKQRLQQLLVVVAKEVERISNTEPATPTEWQQETVTEVEPVSKMLPSIQLIPRSEDLPDSAPKAMGPEIAVDDDASEEYTPMARLDFRRTTRAR